MYVARETSHSDHSRDFWQSHAQCQVCHCWDQSPFTVVALVTRCVSCWTPAHPTHWPGFPTASTLSFPWQMSRSIKTLSPGTGTQKQLSWCPRGGTANKGIPCLFYPTFSPQVSLFLRSLWFLPHLHVHPLRCLHHSSSALASKGSAIPGSCCVTQYLLMWLESPIFHTLCYPKGWQLMAYCLRLPHRAQSAFQTASQSASQFASRATWTGSIPHQCPGI